MPSLDDFIVDENKVWFTEGYWPEGVPKQLKDVDGVKIANVGGLSPFSRILWNIE